MEAGAQRRSSPQYGTPCRRRLRRFEPAVVAYPTQSQSGRRRRRFPQHRTGQHVEKPTYPPLIRRVKHLAGPYARSHHPISGGQIGRQPAGDPEADDADRTLLDRGLEGGDKARGLVADDSYPRP
jgi:hypothetical protein